MAFRYLNATADAMIHKVKLATRARIMATDAGFMLAVA